MSRLDNLGAEFDASPDYARETLTSLTAGERFRFEPHNGIYRVVGLVAAPGLLMAGTAPDRVASPTEFEPLGGVARTLAMWHPVSRAGVAVGAGYSCSLIWVVVADLVFHNQVPLDAFEFHGLYPLGLGFSAALVCFVFERSFRKLALRRCRLRELLVAGCIGAGSVLIAFALNLVFGFTKRAAAPQLDWGLCAIGFPVTLLLALGEEVMWRGYLYSQLRARFSFAASAAIIGPLWALWHYPVILHTRFLYADLAPLHALLAITAMTCASSFVACWLRERSNSVWPAVVWHAALNYVAFAWVIPLEAEVDASSRYFRLDTGVLFLGFYVWAGLLFVRDGGRRFPRIGATSC